MLKIITVLFLLVISFCSLADTYNPTVVYGGVEMGPYYSGEYSTPDGVCIFETTYFNSVSTWTYTGKVVATTPGHFACNITVSYGSWFQMEIGNILTCPYGGNISSGICQNVPSCPSPQVRDATGSCGLPGSNAIENNGLPLCSLRAGNPINIGTGNKFQPVSDYRGTGDFPLVFERFYNSHQSTVSNAFGLGSGWRHSYERSIVNAQSSTIATLYRANGSAYDFNLVGNSWVPNTDVNLTLSFNTIANLWQLTTEDGNVETYNANGQLQSIKSRSGLIQTLIYNAYGLMTGITDSSGRSLSFSYDSHSKVLTMQDTAGGLYSYGYNLTNGNLETVTYPDLSKLTYVYNESANVGTNLPHALTGIIDENNQRFATFQYDAYNRAISTQHAGGAEFVGVSYGINGNIITDGLNTSRINQFQVVQGVVKSIGQSQPSGSGCGASASALTYDANGNVTSRTDFNGNRTNYTYDLTRNLETSRTEGLTAAGASTPATRTVTTTWHPTFRLPVQITNASQQTTYAYNSQGDITQKTIKDTTANTTRSWNTAYTYSTVPGVLLQKVEDGPRTDVSDVTTYDYYPADAACAGGHLGCRGQLMQITDALGHITRLNRYSAHGQLEKLTDPNGLVTKMVYDVRQRLTSLDTGGEITSYSYDPAGQVTRVTRPDGAYLAYTYDTAHRLIKTQDNLGNTLTYTLDAMGNRTKEETHDPDGQLAHTQSRVYDALSRLQNLVLPQ
jgi:YD repeat-containing protein